MTRKEKLAYAAGIIDGEGCIGVYSFGQKNNLYPQLNVTSVDKELIEWLVELFGCGKVQHRKSRSTTTKEYWRWDCVGNTVLDVLIQVEPYLVIERKRNKAIMLLDWWPRHAEGQGGKRIPNTPEVMEMRRNIKLEFNEIEQVPV